MADPTTPNLGIPHLLPNSASPEVPVNAGMDAFDARLTGRAVLSIGTSNALVLTQAQQAAAVAFILATGSPGPTAGVLITFLAAIGMGLFTVENQTGKTVTLKVSGQLGVLPTLANGVRGFFLNDGVTVVKLL